jgi:hypothetical protein
MTKIHDVFLLESKIKELQAFKKEALALLKILELDTHPDEYGIKEFIKKHKEKE